MNYVFFLPFAAGRIERYNMLAYATAPPTCIYNKMTQEDEDRFTFTVGNLIFVTVAHMAALTVYMVARMGGLCMLKVAAGAQTQSCHLPETTYLLWLNVALSFLLKTTAMRSTVKANKA
jgi:hypothetical protein